MQHRHQSVPLKISPKSIFVNFGRKKILKIGNCREFDSKQLLYLELVVKISSYLSGNQRNFEKMSENHRKSVVFFRELVFYFSLLKVFFWIEIKFIKFLAEQRAHFFDFLPYFAGKFTFLCQIQPIFAELRKSLPKVCFVGENPGHFTKNSSIS